MELSNPTNFSKKVQASKTTFKGTKDVHIVDQTTAEENIQNYNNHKNSVSNNKYCKISNLQRKELIEAIWNQGERLKDAAERLNINYSSAKSILRIFKKEGRSDKKPAKNRYTNRPKPVLSQEQAYLELAGDPLTPQYSLPLLKDNISPYKRNDSQSDAQIVKESKGLEGGKTDFVKSQLGKRFQLKDFFESPLIKDQVLSCEKSELEGSIQNSVPNLNSDLKMQQAQEKDFVDLPNARITMPESLNKNLNYPVPYNNNTAVSPSYLNQMPPYHSMQTPQVPFFPTNQPYAVIFPSNNQTHFPMGQFYSFVANPNVPQMPMQQIIIMTPMMPVSLNQQTNVINQNYVPGGTDNQPQHSDIAFTGNPIQINPHSNTNFQG